MIEKPINNWLGVQAEVLKRIHDRTWRPGDIIPRETDLASEFGCARVTVNRALRTLADKGVLDRKRKVGTTVALYPTSKATLKIPLIRKEIEEKNILQASLIAMERAYSSLKIDADFVLVDGIYKPKIKANATLE